MSPRLRHKLWHTCNGTYHVGCFLFLTNTFNCFCVFERVTQGFDSALISLYMYSGMLTVSSWFNLPKKMDKLQATLQIHWLTVLCLSLLCLVRYGRISCDSATPDYLYSLRGSTRSSRVDGFMDDFFDWYLLTVRRFQPMQLQPATAKKISDFERWQNSNGIQLGCENGRKSIGEWWSQNSFLKTTLPQTRAKTNYEVPTMFCSAEFVNS